MADFASTAYMLISHGSRDPRPGQAMERLTQLILSHIQQHQVTVEVQSPAAQVALTQSLQAKMSPERPLQNPDSHLALDHSPLNNAAQRLSRSATPPLVGTGCLELSPIPLHQQLVDFSRRAAATGVKAIRVVPLFLLKGVHVMEDIPEEIQQAQQALPEIAIELCPHLGSHPKLKQVLHHKRQAGHPKALLLLGHGSRRPGGNDPIHALAQALGGTAAFWAVAPSLEDQVIQLMQSGVQELTILPYFLFAGKTTDAITHATEELAERFPQMTLHLLPPLGPTEQMASLVADLALNRVRPHARQSSRPLERTAFRYPINSPMVS